MERLNPDSSDPESSLGEVNLTFGGQTFLLKEK